MGDDIKVGSDLAFERGQIRKNAINCFKGRDQNGGIFDEAQKKACDFASNLGQNDLEFLKMMKSENKLSNEKSMDVDENV